jgi:hypothetical protein
MPPFVQARRVAAFRIERLPFRTNEAYETDGRNLHSKDELTKFPLRIAPRSAS